MERRRASPVPAMPAGSIGDHVSSALGGSPEMLLYVWEDCLEAGMETVTALREAGYRVEMMPATEFRCRRVVRNNKLGLVMFDISAPDSLVLCRRLRRVWHRAIMVILRGHARPAVMRAFAAGADMYLVAPFAEAELVARVAALLRRLLIS